jgi:hypothetical protein
MRTTIRLDDDLLLEIKQLAARSGKTLTSVIEDALREMLARLPCFHAWKSSVILPDIDVLVYGHREDTPNHAAYREWLESVINSDQGYAAMSSGTPRARGD